MDKNNYFEGEYRRRPSQNLSGVNRTMRIIDFIDRVKRERKKREDFRTEIKKAIIIQAAFRGTTIRKHIKYQLKLELVSKVMELNQKEKNTDVNLNDIKLLVVHIQHIFPKNSHWSCYIVREKCDYDNIMYISKIVLRCLDSIILAMLDDADWFWRIVRLLYLFMDLMKPMVINFEEMIPNLLIAIKSYLDPNVYKEKISEKRTNVFLLLMERVLSYGLFNILIRIIERKYSLPHLFSQSFAHCRELFEIVFAVVSCTKNCDFREKILKIVAEEIICKEIPKESKRLFYLCFVETKHFPLEILVKLILNINNEKWFTIYTLHNFLSFFNNYITSMPDEEQKMYFSFISKLTINIPILGRLIQPLEETVDSGSKNTEIHVILNDCLNMINSCEETDKWLKLLSGFISRKDFDGLFWFSKNLYYMWLFDCSPVYKYNLIKRTAFPALILKPLWKYINSEKRILSYSSHLYSTTVLDMLSKGVPITATEADRIIPMLTIFSFFFKNHVTLLNDDLWDEEGIFPEGEDQTMFTLDEIASICDLLKDVAIGIISLAFPSVSVHGVEKRIDELTPTSHIGFNILAWRTLLEQLVNLLWLLHDRDRRQQFMKGTSSWLSGAYQDFKHSLSHLKKIGNIIPFSSPPESVSRDFAVYEKRYLCNIRTLPFTVEFLKRFTLYQSYIADEKMELQNPTLHFLHVPYVFLRIRRDYLYEDALEKLSSELDIRKQIRVHFVSLLGVEELGIDGGGLFREFLIEFLQTAFDPNRGFFILNRENEFYPNPNISAICDDYETHYNFIGKMLGKAMFENILVEIPLADFFLNELLGHCNDLYINGLATLDPDLYKNLISLSSYKGEINELGLDFTLTFDDFGENRVIEIKQDGANISVNEENLIEYIHLVAKCKTHTQIEVQTSSFIDGLNSIISLDWLRMFTAKEMQLIVSGDKSPIDVDDMKKHTIYSGGYSAQHPTIIMFWKVVNSFSNSERCLLLRFVTSCSRPPLLGFKELFPPFCILLVETHDNRLPSSSTCMNILKLPEFTNKDIMREKLLYAIQSKSGFEMG